MPAVKAAVVSTEAIDDSLQLGTHAVVIQRRSEDDHIGSKQLFTNHLNIILLYAGAFISAFHAADAGMDIRVADIDDFHRMPSFLGSSFEIFHQDACRAVPVRASHKYNDLHAYLLIFPDPIRLQPGCHIA